MVHKIPIKKKKISKVYGLKKNPAYVNKYKKKKCPAKRNELIYIETQYLESTY